MPLPPPPPTRRTRHVSAAAPLQPPLQLLLLLLLLGELFIFTPYSARYSCCHLPDFNTYLSSNFTTFLGIQSKINDLMRISTLQSFIIKPNILKTWLCLRSSLGCFSFCDYEMLLRSSSQRFARITRAEIRILILRAPIFSNSMGNLTLLSAPNRERAREKENVPVVGRRMSTGECRAPQARATRQNGALDRPLPAVMGNARRCPSSSLSPMRRRRWCDPPPRRKVPNKPHFLIGNHHRFSCNSINFTSVIPTIHSSADAAATARGSGSLRSTKSPKLRRRCARTYKRRSGENNTTAGADESNCLYFAADPGMVLRVEFRDNFELEDQEKCIYDFLEVRDGKYGYSRLIGRFCRAFPFPEITSSSRYLWLHFRSDNSIQGAGFRAVWSMIPRPSVKTPESEECVLNVTNQMEYEIKTSEIADRKKIAVEQGTELDCIWNITVPEGWKPARTTSLIVRMLASRILYAATADPTVVTVLTRMLMFAAKSIFLPLQETIRQSRENRLDELGRKSTPCSMVEPCMEVHGGERARSSETPSLDGQAANSRDGQSRASMPRQTSLGHSLDLSDIHQSNNVSNATQERRTKVVGSRETRDMECQTRESIFESGLVLKPIAHPVFTTFGFNNSAEPQRASMERGADSTSRRDSPEPPRAYKLAAGTASREPSPVAAVPPPPPPPSSYQCQVCNPPTELCFRHSLTPIVPAPHGWSAHESNYSSDELASLQRAATAAASESPGPASNSSGSESATAGPPSTVFGLVRQRTLGSGEHYGFIYGRDGSTTERGSLSTSASGSHRSGLVKPVKCPQVTDSQFKTEAVIEIDQHYLIQKPLFTSTTKLIIPKVITSVPLFKAGRAIFGPLGMKNSMQTYEKKQTAQATRTRAARVVSARVCGTSHVSSTVRTAPRPIGLESRLQRQARGGASRSTCRVPNGKYGRREQRHSTLLIYARIAIFGTRENN
ncbi:unnamed protein product [Trichogramma brassicae]|uniref:CUB domain-containing protein n=1 Tax=Trichogramma brassicae TaxID=86971 RepID=A0A6H5J692_9HYME|nr:unnamed protein product [Trichogramma brassicae]